MFSTTEGGMSNGQVLVNVGKAGAAIAIAGVPMYAAGGAALIAATGGAAAVVLVGFGAYKLMSGGSEKGSRK